MLDSCQEFAALREAISNQGWLEEGRLAVVGASMGGMTALGILARHPDIKCGASLMGSGYFMSLSRTLFPSPDFPAELAEWDVTHQLEKLAMKPLLLWHGEDDDVVPAAETFRLQQALRGAGLDAKLICEWQAGVRHRITPEALSATVAFFQKYL